MTLDYVNELSGPPFARIDLGCDGSARDRGGVRRDRHHAAPAAAPERVGEHPAPLMCGSQNVPAAELARWRDDSIASGCGRRVPLLLAAEGCQGENLGTGNADAVASLIANCVPRHR